VKQGRPLRFLALVLGGWTGLRTVMLWPGDLPVPIAPALAKADEAVATLQPRAPGRVLAFQRVPDAQPARASLAPRSGKTPATGKAPQSAPADRPNVASLATTARAAAVAPDSDVSIPLAPLPTGSARGSRWAADLWLAVRPGDVGGLGVGQLGGSQGGARVTYALDDRRRVSLSARAFAPLRGRGAEAGLGLDIRPVDAPLHLLLEQRVGLDGGGSQPAVALIGGGSLALPRRARLDGYGQAGAVRRRGAFADGAAQLVVPVAERNGIRLEGGAGLWGAAQRYVARLDVGPSAALVLPARGSTVRLQLDYRVRIAGDARPGPGPALSLGGSF
jgi:hypothetical protein